MGPLMATTLSKRVIKLSWNGHKILILTSLALLVYLQIYGINYGNLRCPLNRATSYGESLMGLSQSRKIYFKKGSGVTLYAPDVIAMLKL
jgi:hypothetical protein